MVIVDIGNCEFCGGSELSISPVLRSIICRKIANAIESLDDEFVDLIMNSNKTNSKKLSLIRHLLVYEDKLDNEHRRWVI